MTLGNPSVSSAPLRLGTSPAAGDLEVRSALAMGNTVVHKPAQVSSLSALRFGELALEAGVPAGVLNIVPGAGSVVGSGWSPTRPSIAASRARPQSGSDPAKGGVPLARPRLSRRQVTNIILKTPTRRRTQP